MQIFDESYSALLGGSFNPLHVGHMRMALEVHRVMALEKIIFLPCASPALKSAEHLLPFDFRVEMVRKSIEPYKQMEVCTIEGERKGPSYTIDTFELLHKSFLKTSFGFILGSEYISLLPSWHRWQELLTLTDLIVLARDNKLAVFEKDLYSLFPEAKQIPAQKGISHVYKVNESKVVYYLEQPLLCISSSMVRKYWCTKANTDYLLPAPVHVLLEKEKNLVKQKWCC